MTRHTTGVRKAVKALAMCGLGLVAFVVLLELAFRYQVIDAYKPELRSYNEACELQSSSTAQTMLIMGDSFSAGTSAYPSMLRSRQATYRVINAAIPGTSLKEALLVAPGRFRQFSPSIFIYQVYVGNDLIELRYPIDWRRLSLIRNVYWSMSRYVWSVRYLNYRLGQLMEARRTRPSVIEGNAGRVGLRATEREPFEVERYNFREKLLFQAEPSLLEDQILVRGDRRKDYRLFLAKLGKLLSYCQPERCKAYLLVLPHACQVHPRYMDHMERLGATLSDADQLSSEEYPFIAGIGRFVNQAGLGNVSLLNPLPLLRDYERRGITVYYQNNAHLNRRGQSVLADLLLRELRLGE